MRKIFSVALAFFAGTLQMAAAEVEKDGSVLVLNDENFDEELKNHKFLLVEFYAPWCGHCKNLAPEYESAAKTLSEKENPISLAKIDATAEKKLTERFDIQGFPTLKWFVDGKDSEYTGGRTADTIVAWITKKTGNPSDAVPCDALDHDEMKKTPLSLVYFGDETEGPVYDLFLQAAKNDSVERFHFVNTGAECAEKYGVTAPGISLLRTFDEPSLAYSGEMTEQVLVDWMEANSLPTLFQFSSEYIEPVFGKKKDTVILFSEDKKAPYQMAFRQSAKNMKGEILFSTSGMAEGIEKKLAEFVGVDEQSMPTMRIIIPGASDKLKKYVYQGDMSTLRQHDIEQFVHDYKAGNLKETRRSDPVPESNDGPVTIVVADNWKKIVADETKDVLVMYYAPWCGHCKLLKPKWEELGEHVKELDDLVIAKMDFTTNEVAEVLIRGYPTLRWYPKDNKKGVEYSDGRDMEDFKNFFEKNSASYAAKFGVKKDEL